MTTARVMISEALRDIGVVGPADAIDADDADFALTKLNTMLDEWAADSFFAYARTETTANVSAISATIGTSQTFNVARPIRLEEGCFSRQGDTDYPLRPITQVEYAQIADKTTTGSWPQYVYYQSAAPTGTLYFWPVPSAAVEVHLFTLTVVSAFATLDTDISLAQGYRSAITSSLGEVLCAPYQRPVPDSLARIAKRARDAVQRANVQPIQLRNRSGTSRLSGILGDVW